MCGISGAVTLRPGLMLRPVVERIVAHQHARGPDASKVAQVETGLARIVLGHNRLSIIDPAPESDQPMSGDHGDLLVFNGEIYNYRELREELEALGDRFRTRSDSEVLMKAYARWGEAAFDRFFGMFAFALYDVRRSRLVLVRDRFGVKPLYWWSDGRTLAFASTPTVIAEWQQLKPNLEYVGRGIQLKYYEDETDIAPFVGLQALPPGHFASVPLDGGELCPTPRPFYDFAARVRERTAEVAAMPAAAQEQRLTELLTDACRLRLRSDVPVGVSVSGGLDSSSVVALTSALGVKLHGFSFGKPDDAWSEGPLVAELARMHGNEVSYIWPTRPEELADLLQRTLRAQGAPFPHSSQMAQYAVFERTRQENVKVLLGGQGGDEAFMGYRKFFLFALQDILRRRRVQDLPLFVSNAAVLLPAILKRAGVFWGERHRYSGRSAGMGSRLNLPALTRSPTPAMGGEQSVAERQMLDITRYSLPSLLRYEDRNSLGNSIESRLPFLDHRVLEWGVALPLQAKLRGGYGKHVMRRIMKGRIPDSIRLSRDKRGFDTRHADWIRSSLGNVLREQLAAEKSVVRDFMGRSESMDQAFSDEQLIAAPQAFNEAVSLLWMSRPYDGAPAQVPLRAAS